jgi:hypothetical protein
MGDAPLELMQALVESDAGGLYTYFISDFIRNSEGILNPSVGSEICSGLRAGEERAFIGPSADAEQFLDAMQKFLFRNVFEVSRIKNRNRMLRSVTEVSLDLLFDKRESALEQMVTDRANLENWASDKRSKAVTMLDNDVHRAQLAVDVFSGMGDQEVFEFVGISSF